METREKILEGAGKLFIQHGIREVTMDSIASSLGMSKRTIYENFKDKEDLIKSYLTMSAIRHKSALLEIIRNSSNVIDALLQFGSYNRNIFSKINPLLFSDLKKYHAKLFDGVMGSEDVRNYEISFVLLKRGVNEGTFIKSIDINIVNIFIHNTMDYFFRMDQEHCFPHSKVWGSIILPYIKGICTDKGLELLNSFIKKKENLAEL